MEKKVKTFKKIHNAVREILQMVGEGVNFAKVRAVLEINL